MSELIWDSHVDLKNELRNEVYLRAKSSAIAHMLLTSIFIAISWSFLIQNPVISIACGTLIALNFLRLLAAIQYNSSKTFSSFINWAHDIGAVGSGLCWGALFITTYLKTGLYTPYSLSLYVLISGVAGGAVGSLASQVNIFLVFINFILTIPGITMIIHENTYEQKLFGFLLIIYAFFLSLQSKQGRENLIAKIKMESYLQNEKTKLEELFNSTPGITALVDRSDKITISNLEWKKIYPENVELFEIDYHLGELIYHFKKSNATEYSSETELGESFRYGIYFISMNKISSSKGIIISLINVTEHKKASFEIQRHKDNIQHNSRMIELGEMVGGVAHEINNPLSISIGKMFLLKNMLEKGNFDKDKISKFVDDSNIALDRISKIVARMKSISRKSEEDPFSNESFDNIMDVVILMTSPKMKEKNVKFINAISSKDIELFCRPSQIEQVLINLFNNSVDAIENNAERWVKIETVDEPENIMIKITDSGHGITEEVRNNIWNSFYTTKANGKGTGLGLSISLQIIESHNGKIYIDTNCTNTCFIIELQKAKLAQKAIG